MNQKQADDFQALYSGLKYKVLNLDFDMSNYCNGNPSDLFKKQKCGTTGSLAGYLPVFVDGWYYISVKSKLPCLISQLVLKIHPLLTKSKNKIVKFLSEKDIDESILVEQISKFFGISQKDTEYLIWDHDTEEFRTRKEKLYQMIDIADKYGWDITY